MRNTAVPGRRTGGLALPTGQATAARPVGRRSGAVTVSAEAEKRQYPLDKYRNIGEWWRRSGGGAGARASGADTHTHALRRAGSAVEATRAGLAPTLPLPSTASPPSSLLPTHPTHTPTP